MSSAYIIALAVHSFCDRSTPAGAEMSVCVLFDLANVLFLLL